MYYQGEVQDYEEIIQTQGEVKAYEEIIWNIHIYI